jgi:H+-transporting ATPase
MISLSISTILACAWPPAYIDGVLTVGLLRREPYALVAYIWIYCLIVWMIQDAFKVFGIWLMRQCNALNINASGKLVEKESTRRFIEEHNSIFSE